MSDARRLLTVVGDANDIATWSGIPYFFLRSGKRHGLLDAGVSLDPRALSLRRAAWNAKSLVLTRQAGGYQYTPDFLSRLFAQARLAEDESLEFVTHFPLLPSRPWGSNWKVTPYIDATLKQNFEDYGLQVRVSRAVRENALARERDAYQAAERVVCMSRWAADAVTGFYGVSSSRCHVVLPGANLVEEEIGEHEAEPTVVERSPLRLGFIGKDWKRKGLPLLLTIADELTRRGVSAEVITIGPDPRVLPHHPLLRAQGFVHKHREMDRFVQLVRSFHFGCLLSSVEALGISTLECLRLGVPVIGTRVGGIVDAIPDGLGFLFDPGGGLDEIASTLESHAKDPEQYAALRRRVARRAREFSWNQTAIRFSEFFVPRRGGSGDDATVT